MNLKPSFLFVIALSAVSLAQTEDAASLRARASAALAPIDGELVVPGLQARVEVIRDRWGLPHIYAATVEDLFFAQGFVAAQDRLWQLELWRRTAEGTLSEVLGPEAIDRDVFARLLRYRGDMDAEWSSYAPDARKIAGAFVAGINAQVAFVAAHPEKLPLEFQLTGLRPQAWTPEVVISRMAGYVMTRNARTEVQRARLAQAIGVTRMSEWMPPEPAVRITVPEGLDLADITEHVLALAESAADPLRFDERRPAAARRDDAAPLLPIAAARGARAWPAAGGTSSGLAERLASLRDELSVVGSNNWVVSGARTASGRPLLANDPHRPLQLPSLRYSVHLNGPGWNVIGAGEPALPGVAAGHNDRIAFGFTIVGIDQQDLYVERLNPADPDQYLYRGAWEPMRVEREWVPVRGQAPRSVEMRFTRHGPVVHVDRARHRAYALRWVGTEPGTAGYLASLSLNTARTWPEFLAALERWKVPSENLVYADVDGNIGWVAAGLAPIRPGWTGLLPVPGHEGRYEWSGFLPLKDLPQSFNPASGLIATANHNILPPEYPRMLGYEWTPPHRYRRIMEVLGPRKGLVRADFEALQHDEVSVPARAIIDALRVASVTAPPATPDRAFALKVLLAWDGRLDRDSGPAALYSLWLPHVQRALMATVVRADERSHVPERLSLEQMLAILEAPSRDQLAALTGPALDAAWQEARSRMGSEPATWAWGRVHHASFEHPLATSPARAEVLNLPAVPRGGDATTVNNTGNALRQVHGASFREVVDVGAWDESTTINVPGLSGQPASRHYGDLLPLWATGRYHPMPFSREAVEKHAAARLTLLPEGSVRRGSATVPATSGVEAAADVRSPPTLPPFAGTIVNFDRRGARTAACAMDPAGGERQVGARRIPNTRVWVVEEEVVRQLGESTGACDPVWSPGGTRLAVVQPNGLWTYTPTLEDPVQLAETHLPSRPQHATDYTAFARPRWSPDGRHLAFLVTNGATTWVEVIDSTVGRVEYTSPRNVSEFSWGADSRSLVIDGVTVRLP